MTVARDCLHCETGRRMERFEGKTFTIEHAGQSATVQSLSGWRRAGCAQI
jgi:hypothetical protein